MLGLALAARLSDSSTIQQHGRLKRRSSKFVHTQFITKLMRIDYNDQTSSAISGARRMQVSWWAGSGR